MKDSHANGGQAIVAGGTSIDRGDNFNWTFLILGITLSTHSYDFGMVSMGIATVSTNAITITNSGNATETYALSVTTTGAKTLWTIGVSTPTSMDKLAFFGLFNTVQPSSTTFHYYDLLDHSHRRQRDRVCRQ